MTNWSFQPAFFTEEYIAAQDYFLLHSRLRITFYV